MELSALRWSMVMILSCLGALWDIRTRRIPNWLTLPALLAGIVSSVFWGGAAGPVWSVVAAIVVAFPAFVLFAFAGGGAGDVKLLGALGSWLGLREGLIVLACVAAAGVVCGVVTALLRRRGAGLLVNLWRIVGGLTLALSSRRVAEAHAVMPDEKQMQTMPYAVPILLGVCLAATGGWLW